ncbi:hypothetical protein RJ641_016097 [Dillenia turbinata]|uniref:F-box domain-containing protein n=1 Tax=Dillenia turbinata TaxID=194707 RepID=A0AAN8Z4B6_9MAGN
MFQLDFLGVNDGISGSAKMEEIDRDFLNWLEMDTSVKILSCLEDPTDLARICCVSRSWRQFGENVDIPPLYFAVISNGLLKQLCLKLFPQLADVAQVMEVSCRTRENAEVGAINSSECEALETDHRVYASLARVLTSDTAENCIVDALFASSTDNYPLESIQNTLDPRTRVQRRALYWSSKGQSNPEVPEALTYKLNSDFCVLTEICIMPFQAYFQAGSPIYSAQAVRFQMGYRTLQADDESDDVGTSNSSSKTVHDNLRCEQLAEKKFTWTYTSQEFPMAQENSLQRFKLPVPILCIGGILRIELLGRVQRQEMDDLFYICVAHVRALGWSISSRFGFEIMKPSGKLLLKYFPEGRCEDPLSSPQVEYTSSGLPILPEGLVQEEQWNEIVDLLNEADAAYGELFHVGPPEVDPESEDDFADSDEEMFF